MDDNPSRFKGENRPAERVSWDDVRIFNVTLNQMKPELKLYLPTEAQWEYACRAGSTTPFCRGEQINSELVNFTGTAPYNMAKKVSIEKSTVDVRSFHQNNWGLWQMHGNVAEWCQDWFGKYQTEPVIDPFGLDTGGTRVLCGGLVV